LFYSLAFYIILLGITLIKNMKNASEDIEVLRSELYTIAILLVLVIVSYLLLGSSNILLYFD